MLSQVLGIYVWLVWFLQLKQVGQSITDSENVLLKIVFMQNLEYDCNGHHPLCNWTEVAQDIRIAGKVGMVALLTWNLGYSSYAFKHTLIIQHLKGLPLHFWILSVDTVNKLFNICSWLKHLMVTEQVQIVLPNTPQNSFLESGFLQ